MQEWILKACPKSDFGELNFDFENNCRVLKLGLGSQELSRFRFRKLIHKAMRFLQSQKAKLINHNLNEFCDGNNNFIETALLEANYIFDKFKSKKDNLVDLSFLKQNPIVKAIQASKDLINSPANIVNPKYLVNYVLQMAESETNIEVKVLNQRQCQELGLNAFLAVAQGSRQEPYLIEINYKPKSAQKETIGLIGKGITFDTGGLCLKPNNYMYGMQSDMAGAATVIGILQAAAQIKLSVAITGLIPACENSFGANSYRPGDIIKAFNGKTIEIIDTDAEGRLTLADAIAYLSQKENIKTIIDYATLTGSCVSALGEIASGAFSNSNKLLENYKAASEEVGEPIWELPLFEEYKENLESSVADLAQCEGKPDASLAAIFLKEFLKEQNKQNWLHLDIAGTAYLDTENEFFVKGATGRHIWSTIDFLRKHYVKCL